MFPKFLQTYCIMVSVCFSSQKLHTAPLRNMVARPKNMWSDLFSCGS